MGTLPRSEPTAADARPPQAPSQPLNGETALLGALAEAVPALVLVIDADGRILHANSHLQAYTGQAAQALAGRSWLELLHPSDHAMTHAAWQDAVAAGRTCEMACTLVSAQGPARRFQCRAVPAWEGGCVTHWAISAAESPQGMLVQQAPGRGEARNGSTFEHTAAGIAHVAHDGRFLAVNDRFCAIAGHDRDELLSSRFQHITHPQDLAADEANVAALVQGRIDHYTMDKRYLRADGSTVWVRLMVGLARREDGSPDHFVSVIDDISAHKAAQEELRRHRDTVHALLHNSPFGIVLIDADFRLREASLGARRAVAGIDPLIGRDCAEVLRIVWNEPFASEAIEQLRHTLHTGEPFVAPCTVQPCRDSGEVQVFEWRTEQVLLPDGRAGVVCYFHDLSERVAWEAALRESEQRLLRAARTAMVRAVSDGSSLVLLCHKRSGLL